MRRNEFDKLLREGMETLTIFCQNHKNIYIYGAGDFGQGYLAVLHHAGFEVSGFIVSKKNQDICRSLSVYTVEEAGCFLTKEDGIIPAFTGSSPEEIAGKFPVSKPDVLVFDHQLMCLLQYQFTLFPILERLDAQFGVPAPVLPKENWKSILIVRLDMIGDMVFTTAMLRELKANYPESDITMVAGAWNGGLLKNCPYLSRIVLYECPFQEGELSRQCENSAAAETRAAEFVPRSLGNKQFDVVILPRNFLCGRNVMDELFLAFYCGAKRRIVRMMSLGLERRFLCERMKKSCSLVSYSMEPMHETAYTLAILKDCGLLVKNERMELWPGTEERRFADKVFGPPAEKKGQIFIALGIVASVDVRTWKIENYQTLIRRFRRRFGTKYRFVVFGGTNAEDSAKKLEEEKEILINLAGKTGLAQTVACMERCDLYVGSNTGLLHIASALEKPSVTIYSELSDGKPTDGDSPFRMGAWMVPHIDLIPPAGLDGCHGVCKMRDSHCINQILPKHVERGILKLMAERGKDR